MYHVDLHCHRRYTCAVQYSPAFSTLPTLKSSLATCLSVSLSNSCYAIDFLCNVIIIIIDSCLPCKDMWRKYTSGSPSPEKPLEYMRCLSTMLRNSISHIEGLTSEAGSLTTNSRRGPRRVRGSLFQVSRCQAFSISSPQGPASPGPPSDLTQLQVAISYLGLQGRTLRARVIRTARASKCASAFKYPLNIKQRCSLLLNLRAHAQRGLQYILSL